MRRTLVLLALFCALALFISSTASAITISTVPVGNPGNAADPANSGSIPGIGSVGYSYSIGTYDVTVDQYTGFLNAVAATDTYSLYNPSMATDLNVAGIAQNGISGSFTYSVIGSANHPITFVSWGDAARFANWLSNGQPTGTEGNGTTETGSYTLNGATTNTALNAITRNANATWVIPTENEWYKAAYYNPGTSSYYTYPYSSSTTPTSAMPGNTPNTANFLSPSSAFAVTGSTSYSSTQNYMTDVGAYTASASPYGAYDMGGDAFQWNETLISGSSRGTRGGSWDSYSNALVSTDPYNGYTPVLENEEVGFRVAIVPEPSTFVLALIGLGSAGMLCLRRRKA
jgi:formylglycine-generating enzyme required for sulfatase activity